MDNRTGLAKKPPSVVKITTPLPQTGSVFKFSESEIKAETENYKSQNLSESKYNNAITERPMPLKILQDANGNPGEMNMPSSDIESPVEMRRPRMSFKTVAKIAGTRLRRYSSINEQDIKETIENLRSPAVDGTKFCFSPVREFSSRNLLAFSPAMTNANNWFDDRSRFKSIE